MHTERGLPRGGQHHTDRQQAADQGAIFGCDGPTCGVEHDQENVKIRK